MGIRIYLAAALLTMALLRKTASKRGTAILLGASLIGLLPVLAPFGSAFAASAPTVEITEVVSDNESSYAAAPYGGLDWIELHNAGDAAVSLEGWTLSDGYGKISGEYALPDIRLQPGGYCVIFADKTYGNEDGYCLPFGISRQGETLYLRNARGDLVCSVDVPKLVTDVSWAKGPDGRFGYCLVPTPGRKNTGTLLEKLPVTAAQGHAAPQEITLWINEVSSNGTDWLELCNPMDQAVSLETVWLSDSGKNAAQQQLPEVDLPAGGYIVLSADPAEGQYPLELGISSQGEILQLQDEMGRSICMLDLPPLERAVWARRPDGTFGYCGDPTPGAENSAKIYDTELRPMSDGEPLRLSEAMYRNRISLIDAYGDRSDWVELYNDGSETISLAGYYLSDSVDDPAKWPFPERDLGPGEYLVVFLSGKDSTPTELHASFSVAEGETGCVLYCAKTLSYALLPYPRGLGRNVSVGLDAQGRVVYFGYPTPGYENAIAFEAEPASFFPNGELIISEVSADGQAGEWIELYNRGSEQVSLEGWALTNDLDQPGKLPLSGTLAQQGYRVIELSGGKKKPPFSISLSGESLYLTDPRGAVRDVLETGVLRTGYTAGRLIERLEQGRVTFLTPTKGAPNGADYRQGYGPTPLFSDVSLYHEEPFLLSITTGDPEAVIHYTLDGSKPDESDPVYTEPLAIAEDTAVRAVSAVPGKVMGEEMSATYLFRQPYPVPVVTILTEKTAWDAVIEAPKKGRAEKPARIAFYEPDGALGTAFPAGISPRGNSSIFDPQKSVNLHLHGFYGQDTVYYPFWGPGTALEESFLILRTASQDSEGIHMRNAFATRIAAETHVMTAMTRPVVLYANGSYYGIMDLNEGMNHDYLRARYGSNTETVNIVLQNNTKKHGSTKGYLALRRYAKNHDFSDPAIYESFCRQVDMDALIDYVILQTYFANYDYSNQAWWNADDGTVLWQPYFYDLDRAMNSTGCGKDRFALYFKKKTSYKVGRRTRYLYNEIYYALRKNKTWRLRFAERYAELMGTVLSERHLIEVLTAMADELRPVLPEHIAVWKEPVNMKTWETNLEFTKRLIKERRQKVGDMVTRYMKISRKQWEAMLAKYEDQ